MFDRKYKKVLKIIDSEITRYEAEMKSYETIWEDLRKNDPKNDKGLNAAEFMYEQFKNRHYALIHLRNNLLCDIS